MAPVTQQPRRQIESVQWEQLRSLLASILPNNPFYRRKLVHVDLAAVVDLASYAAAVPLTTKAELVQDQTECPPYGSNLTFPLDQYSRFHQTSGTSGHPLHWLDTRESWAWMRERWVDVLLAAGIARGDRILFAFSFGPFLGFWLAFEAAEALGCLCLPGGGLNSAARLRLLREHRATALCCTPTYALHLAETAARDHGSVVPTSIRRLIVAGEPGGSIPETRHRLEQAWLGATVFDHHGMTEIGPVTLECPDKPGHLHVMENAFIPEILNPQTGRPVPPGTAGELILTNLGRVGSPLLRYRTGDLVCAVAPDPTGAPCSCGRADLLLAGGILGRIDDMIIVRGVNLYPSAVEAIVRAEPTVAEYRVRVQRRAALTEVAIDLEPIPEEDHPDELATRLARIFQDRLALRVPVQCVPPGTLPRFELKARRWVETS
jgi:phenylacetate-CoA ligase